MEFKDILDKTMKWEGGWSDDAHDAGGKTNWGITQATLGVWLHRPASVEEIRALTKDEARKIYEKMYFTDPKFHLLPESIRGVMFDIGVNAGPGRATRILQTLINKIGDGGIVTVDGGLGPITINAAQLCIDAIGDTAMVNALCDERQAFYNAIVVNNPSQNRFILGWTRRADDWRIV